MTDTHSTDLRCERVRLLLSLSIDDATTPEQDAEIAAHLPECGGCRAAQAADVAVRARCAEPAAVPTGFAGRVVARVNRQRLEARAQNRFLIATAIAAVLVAGVALTTFGSATFGSPPDRPTRTMQADAVRETAGRALRAGLASNRTPRGPTPGTGVEDR
jgi:predicted anti-sigma-YlaC factor YlaD